MNDRFQNAGDDAPANRIIQGELLKFTNTATWVGRSGEELSGSLELVAVDTTRVVQRWNEGRPIETLVLQPGENCPNFEELNATVPRSEWRLVRAQQHQRGHGPTDYSGW
jgi:hypothetical protein